MTKKTDPLACEPYGIKHDELPTVAEIMNNINNIEKNILINEINKLKEDLYDRKINLEKIETILDHNNKNIYYNNLQDYLNIRKNYDQKIDQLKSL